MKHNTAIHNALLKYGYSNFTLDIIEYCEGVNPVLREQFYFDLLKPLRAPRKGGWSARRARV